VGPFEDVREWINESKVLQDQTPLQKVILLGIVPEKNTKKGRQRNGWGDNIQEWNELTFGISQRAGSKSKEMAGAVVPQLPLGYVKVRQRDRRDREHNIED